MRWVAMCKMSFLESGGSDEASIRIYRSDFGENTTGELGASRSRRSEERAPQRSPLCELNVGAALFNLFF